MKKILLISILYGVIALGSASAQIASDTIGCVPVNVQFTSPQPHLSNVLWDFGDGTSSSLTDPSHVFIQVGEYNVLLKHNDTLVAQVKVRVLPEVEPSFTTDVTVGCAPVTVSFNHTTSIQSGLNLIGVLWDFGDGQGSTDLNPQNTYTHIGNYPIALTVNTSIEQCNNTYIFDDYIRINNEQNVDFQLDSISHMCSLPISAYFSYSGDFGPSYTYLWDFGNGISDTKRDPDPVLYQSEGKYVITLRVDDGQNCVSTIKKDVDIRYNPIVQVNMPAIACLNQNMVIDNNSIGQDFSWVFGPQAQPTTSSDMKPSNIVYNTLGPQEITLSITSDQGCTIDTTFNITVGGADTLFTLEPQFVCSSPTTIVVKANADDATSYRWDGEFGDQFQNITIVLPETDSFYYHERDSVSIRLDVVDKNGCIGSSKNYYIVQSVNAQFELSNHEGEAPFFLDVYDRSESDYPIVQWVFSWGDGTSTTYDPSDIAFAGHIYENPGEYYINLYIINSIGCIDEHNGALINVVEPLKIVESPHCDGGSGGDRTICYGDTLNVLVSNLPEGVQAWHANLGRRMSHCETSSYFVYTVLDDPGQTLMPTLTLDNGGYFYEFNVQSFDIGGAKAAIGYQTNCTDRYTVFFKNKSVNAERFYWVIDSTIIRLDSFYHDFKGKGDYDVILIAENGLVGCAPDTARVTIKLRDPIADISSIDNWCPYIPTTLSSGMSEDNVVGCKMGYHWWLANNNDVADIITDKDSIQLTLPHGLHRVYLEVRDVNGCRDTTYKDINVALIIADFIPSHTKLCDPLMASFVSNSISDFPIVSYDWNILPDQNTDSISYTFTDLENKSNIRILLTITDSLGCMSTSTKNLPVYKPTSSIQFDSLMCASNVLPIMAGDYTQNGSSLDYIWQINGMLVEGGGQLNIDHLPVGNYNVQLEIIEKSTGCNNYYDFEFSIVDAPIAHIGILDSLFCFPKTFALSGDSSFIHPMDDVSFLWSFGDNRVSNRYNPIVTFGKGTHNVMLTLTSTLGCQSTDTKKISLVGPNGELMVDKEVVCLGDDVTFSLVNDEDVSSYYWDFGQGQIRYNESPVVYTYDFLPPSSSTFASLILQSQETGCETIMATPISIADFIASFEPDTTCNDTMTIPNLSLGADTYEWTFEQGDITQEFSPFLSVPQPGTYPLTLTTYNETYGCRDTLTHVITFFERPVFSLPVEVTLCGDQEQDFVLKNEYTYTFLPTGYCTINDLGLLTFSASSSSNVEVVAENIHGCTSSQYVYIQHTPFEIEEQEKDLLVCDNYQDINLSFSQYDGDILDWQWNGQPFDTEILSCTNCPTPLVILPIEGVLSLNIDNYNQCLNRLYTFNIANVQVDVPNVFSPNGDDVNDLFRPVVVSELTSDIDFTIHNITVINRWGKEVFRDAKPWDGLIDNKPAPAEVYYFSMSFSLGDQCTKSVKGSVTLLR